MTEDWCISTRYKGTCWVQTDGKIIVDAALWSDFIGQPLTNLLNWLQYYHMKRIGE